MVVLKRPSERSRPWVKPGDRSGYRKAGFPPAWGRYIRRAAEGYLMRELAPAAHLRMFTARAATSARVINETADSTSISIFTRTLSGIVSVGENAVALVKDT